MAEERSKRPSGSAFKQQRLKAWQPLLTPKTVLPTFFVIGIIFIPLGVGLYITSQGVQEILIDYTQCNASATANFADAPGGAFKWKVNQVNNQTVCSVQFTVSADFAPPVYFYYRLTNFYQNHRRYVKSFNADQLRGTAVPVPQLTDCSPLDYITPSPTNLQPTIGYYPCGLIANSLFNDTFSPLKAEDNTFYNFSSKGIAWPGDANRFRTTNYGKNATLVENVIPPPNWSKYKGVWTPDAIAEVASDEHFQVWMRTAGLPTFRKLYGKSSDALKAGTYTIDIVDNYPVTQFDGTKSFVISTSSWMGGKNPFLGIAYLVVGSICIALGIAFLIRHLVAPRKLGDHTYIKWKQSH